MSSLEQNNRHLAAGHSVIANNSPGQSEPGATSHHTQLLDPAYTAELGALLSEADIPTADNPIVNAAGIPAGHVAVSAPNSYRKPILSVGAVFIAVGAAAFASGFLSANKKPTVKVAPTEAATSTTTELTTTSSTVTSTTLQPARPAITIESTPSSTQAPATTTTAANRLPINIDVQALIADALESVQSTTSTAVRRTTTTAAPSTTTSVPVTTTRPAVTSTTQQSSR